MTDRLASCPCGAVRVATRGEPVRVSICHCLACQQRSGSAFAAQARWPDAAVTVTGETRSFSRTADSGNRVTFRFCPTCGATVAYALATQPGVTAIPIGLFATPDFQPAPAFSVFEERKQRWVSVLGDVEHSA